MKHYVIVAALLISPLAQASESSGTDNGTIEPGRYVLVHTYVAPDGQYGHTDTLPVVVSKDGTRWSISWEQESRWAKAIPSALIVDGTMLSFAFVIEDRYPVDTAGTTRGPRATAYKGRIDSEGLSGTFAGVWDSYPRRTTTPVNSDIKIGRWILHRVESKP